MSRCLADDPDFAKKFPLGYPSTVLNHQRECAECQKNNFEPMCEVGSKMLTTWLLGTLEALWEKAGETDSFAA
jgi:hypothetical protein